MSETKEQLPKVFIHCIKTYEMMEKYKSSNEYDGKPVYRGHLTKDMEEHIGLTTAQYSRVMKMLVDMNCVQQLKRGAGRAPSEWVLIGAPTYESFAYVKGEQLKRTHRSPRAEDQRFRDIVVEMHQLSRRLQAVEKKLSELQGPRINDGEIRRTSG